MLDCKTFPHKTFGTKITVASFAGENILHQRFPECSTVFLYCRSGRMMDRLVGAYECRVSNGYGEASTIHSVGITGEVPPKPLIIPGIRVEDVYKGGTVTLTLIWYLPLCMISLFFLPSYYLLFYPNPASLNPYYQPLKFLSLFTLYASIPPTHPPSIHPFHHPSLPPSNPPSLHPSIPSLSPFLYPPISSSIHP